jgi:head-tail adaptor
MNPGLFDKRIVWEKKPIPEELSPLSGEPIEDWNPAPFSPLWGAFEMSGGKDFPLGEKRHAETTARVRHRYRRDIANDLLSTDRYRVRYLGRIWNILDIAVIDDKAAGIRNSELSVELSEIK